MVRGCCHTHGPVFHHGKARDETPLNIPLLLDEIDGYAKADQLIAGVSEAHRGAVAQRLAEGYAVTPTSTFEYGFRLRLDDAVRATPNP